MQLKKFKDTAEECEMLSEKVSQLEKQRAKLDERLTRSQDELQQMKHKCTDRDQIEAKLKMLEHELNKNNESATTMRLEIQRLRTVESELKHFQEKSEDKEQNIYRLIETNNELEKSFATMRVSWDHERVELREKIEEAENRNAELDCECNQLKKKLSDLNESVEVMSRECEEKVANLSSELKAARNLAESNLQLADERSGEMGKLKAELSLRDRQIETIQSQLSGKTADFANLQKFLNEEQKLKEEELSAYEAELDGVKSEMAHAKTTMGAEIERLKGELTRSAETNRQVRQQQQK